MVYANVLVVAVIHEYVVLLLTGLGMVDITRGTARRFIVVLFTAGMSHYPRDYMYVGRRR